MAPFFPCSIKCSLNKGINEALNAPSAKRRRNKLGILNAMKNASAIGPDPKKLAIQISLAKPRIRLRLVNALTVKIERKKTIPRPMETTLAKCNPNANYAFTAHLLSY